MTIAYEGLLLGLATFLVIGLFHPIVIKTEYYFGTRPWWVFLVVGLAGAVGALFVPNLFWSIKELFEQKERVRKGWFPRNPRRKQQD